MLEKIKYIRSTLTEEEVETFDQYVTIQAEDFYKRVLLPVKRTSLSRIDVSEYQRELLKSFLDRTN
jgi:hypothetical protein